MRRTLLCAFAILMLSGCAQTNKPHHNFEDDFKNQILSQQFKKKGADLFCDQPSYLECLKIKRDQCLRELKPFNKECFEYSSGQVNGRISENTEKFGNLFGFCMITKHIMFRGEKDIKEIGMCMQNNPLDENQFQKTLTPTDQEVIVTILKDEYDLETWRNNTVK
jgi:hypothetical protein